MDIVDEVKVVDVMDFFCHGFIIVDENNIDLAVRPLFIVDVEDFIDVIDDDVVNVVNIVNVINVIKVVYVVNVVNLVNFVEVTNDIAVIVVDVFYNFECIGAVDTVPRLIRYDSIAIYYTMKWIFP